jgi:hypothetical protein
MKSGFQRCRVDAAAAVVQLEIMAPPMSACPHEPTYSYVIREVASVLECARSVPESAAAAESVRAYADHGQVGEHVQSQRHHGHFVSGGVGGVRVGVLPDVTAVG